MSFEKFLRNRITQLRMIKNVSEYQMSLDLGHSKSYIQSISSGRALPSMSEFISICEYFGVTPMEFFDEANTNPILLREITDNIKGMQDKDLELLLTLINRLKQ